MEVELVIVAGSELKRHVEPGVMRRVADLEMGNSVSQMSAHDLLPNGMAV